MNLKTLPTLFILVLSLSFSFSGSLRGDPPTNGLVAYYPFNGNANDESGQANHGTVFGATLTADRVGNPESAYSFDGVDDYIDATDAPIHKPTAGLTLALWAQSDSWETMTARGVMAGTTHFGGYNLVANHSGVIRTFVWRLGAYSANVYPLSELSPGWHHFAATYDGRVTTLWIDGVARAVDQAPADAPLGYSYPANSTLIGAEPSAGDLPDGDFFAGKIDEVRIYDRALSGGEITELSGPPAAGIPAITSPLNQGAAPGVPFTYTITATNSPTSFGTGVLPDGLVLADPVNGVISGTPAQAGTYYSTISATNASGTGSATLRITIAAGSRPEIISPLAAQGTVGIPFSYAIVATEAPTSFGAAPLPDGLEPVTANGVISGTPTAAGTYDITISAGNAAGTDSETLRLTVLTAAQNRFSNRFVHCRWTNTVGGVDPNPHTLAVSSDGRKIVFAANDDALYAMTEGDAGPTLIHQYDPTPRNVWVDLSADGSKVISALSDTPSLLTMDFNGGNKRVVAPLLKPPVPPRVTADGNWAYFVHQDGSKGMSGVWKVRTNGADLQQVFGYDDLVATVFGNDPTADFRIGFRGFDINDDGSRVIVDALTGLGSRATEAGTAIVTHDSVSGTFRRAAGGYSRVLGAIAISGDGSRIAYNTTFSGAGRNDLISENFDGSSAATLIAAPVQSGRIDFPRDGSMLLVNGVGNLQAIFASDGSWTIDPRPYAGFTMHLDLRISSNARRIAGLSDNVAPGGRNGLYNAWVTAWNPASPGDAPDIPSVGFDPRWVLSDGSTASTFTAAVAPSASPVTAVRFYTLEEGLFSSGLLEGNNEEMADDGITTGDVTAGDNIWTIDDLRRTSNIPNEFPVRFMAFADPYLTTVDVEPFYIVAAPPAVPAITSPLTALGTMGEPFLYTITATGAPEFFGTSLLPDGLALDYANGVITGTPVSAGTTSVNISASNAGGTDSEVLAITIGPGGAIADRPTKFVHRQLTHFTSGDPVPQEIAISADGQKIIFSGTNENIYTMNADGSGLQEIYDGTGNSAFVDISADGSRVIWTEGWETFHSANFDGSNHHAHNLVFGHPGGVGITQNTSIRVPPRLTADGTTIYFANNLVGATYGGVWRIDFNGDNLEQVFDYVAMADALFATDASEYNHGQIFDHDFDLSDDGSRLIAATNLQGGAIFTWDGISFRTVANETGRSDDCLAISGDGQWISYVRETTIEEPVDSAYAERFDGSTAAVPLLEVGRSSGARLVMPRSGTPVVSDGWQGAREGLFATDGSWWSDLGPYEGHFLSEEAAVSADGKRVVYITTVIPPGSGGTLKQIWIVEVDPASTGDAPDFASAQFDPPWVLFDPQTASTFTAVPVAGADPLEHVRFGVLRDGEFPQRVLWNDDLDFSDDGATRGDAIGGDGIYTMADVRRDLITTPLGDYTIRMSAVAGDYVTSCDFFPFTIVADPGAAWATLHFGPDASDPLIAGPTANPDRDLLVNLLERIYGTDPNDASDLAVPVVRQVQSSSFEFAFPLDTVAASDVELIVECSQTLDDPWDAVMRRPANGSWEVVMPGASAQEVGSEQVVEAVVTIPSGTEQLGQNYARLRAVDSAP